MATRNFVPRKDGEGSIGKGRKQWNVVYADHINTLGRNRSYTVGDIAYSRHLPSWVRLECVKAGTTAGSMPNLAAVSQCGVMITDGSVVWIVDDIRDGTPIGACKRSCTGWLHQGQRCDGAAGRLPTSFGVYRTKCLVDELSEYLPWLVWLRRSTDNIYTT